MNSELKQKFESYPSEAQAALMDLRMMIYEVAKAENLPIEECLRWNQPSYLTKTGSTMRIDWSSNSPKQYRMFFNCNSRLVETFKEIYGDLFTYEGKRAVVFNVGANIPVPEFESCICMALNYHKLKHLPLLGG